jgi:hypothetical protein
MLIRAMLAASVAVLLGACGGGDSGKAPTPSSAEVSLTASASAVSVPSGTSTKIFITVANAGPNAARNILVSPNLGAALARGAVACTGVGGAACPSTTGATFSISSLPASSSLSFEINVDVAPGTSGTVNSSPTVTADNDVSSSNNAGLVAIHAYSADVAVSGSGPIAPVLAGTTTNYTMTVTNSGPDAARDVTVVNTLGAFQRLGTIACSANGGATCPASVGPSIVVPTLPKGGSLVLTVPATVAAGTSGSIANVMTVSSLGDPQPTNNAASVQASAYVAVVQGQTTITLQSDFGDFVGQGASYSYSKANALVSVNATGGYLAVQVTGDQYWYGDFQLPNTLTQFRPGTYSNLTRYPFHDPAVGGLSWTGEGRGCNTLLGSFTVNSATYADTQLTSIDLSFEQRCEGGGAVLRGQIHWYASDTTAPPGPVNPPPAGLWAPAAGATPASGSYVYLESETGDYIGGGGTYTYTKANTLLSVTVSGGKVTVSLRGDQDWTGDFQAMNSITQIERGYYGDLQRYPFHNPVTGGLAWSGEGRGCNRLTGWFAVDSISFSNGVVATLDLRFEQHCEGGTPALRGKIHWDAADTTVPPGPVNPPPAGLWAPAAGATPASGNYVYLISDAGDYIGVGRTYTYTQANATLSVTVNGGTVRVSVNGDEWWNGDFQAMSGVTQLQPGYYGGLQRYPFHNPAKGGLDWGGEGRGCNRLSGWFVVDNVVLSNGALTALDLRFEQHCEGAVPALRGKIHWAAGDTTAPAGPVNPPPSGLWAPASGATPATGNYVYLTSDAGDYIGAGQTYTYTPLASVISVNASGGHLVVSVDGWTGDFQAMNGVSALLPGYYDNLQRYPFHNPTIGGLNWSGQGRGCNELRGWFVVDSATYSNGVLAAIDLRFEQHCEGGAPALRGKIHWVR